MKTFFALFFFIRKSIYLYKYIVYTLHRAVFFWMGLDGRTDGQSDGWIDECSTDEWANKKNTEHPSMCVCILHHQQNSHHHHQKTYILLLHTGRAFFFFIFFECLLLTIASITSPPPSWKAEENAKGWTATGHGHTK